MRPMILLAAALAAAVAPAAMPSPNRLPRLTGVRQIRKMCW